MKITELFDHTAEWTWSKSGTADVATSYLNDNKVTVYFYPSSGGKVVYVAFYVNDDPRATGVNNGDQFKIFGIVVECIHDYIKSQPVEKFWFTADSTEPKRVKLYNAMCSRLQKKIPYTLNTTQETDNVKYVFDRVAGNKSIDYPTIAPRSKKSTVTELFDRAVDWLWHTTHAGNLSAHAEIEGKDVDVTFKVKPNNAVEIDFSVNDEYSATGTGSEVAIFSAVIQAIVKYITEHQPRLVWFTAVTREPKRVKLYNALSKRIGARIPYDAAVSELPTYVRYSFKKKA